MDSFFEAEVEMERKICRDVVCTSHKDEEGKHTPRTCWSHRSHCLEELFSQLCYLLMLQLVKSQPVCVCACACLRFSSGLVRSTSVSVTTSWRFPQQEHEILPEGECRYEINTLTCTGGQVITVYMISLV